MHRDEISCPIPPDSLGRFKELAKGYRKHFELEEPTSANMEEPGLLSFSYIVSTKWLDSFTSYIGYPVILEEEEKAMSSGVKPNRINEDLVEISDNQKNQMVPEGSKYDFLNVKLKDNLAFNEHYRIIEKPAWDFLKTHFEDGIEIKRTNYINEEKTLRTEVYPHEIQVIFFHCSVARDIDGGRCKSLDLQTVRVPGHFTLQQFKEILMERKQVLEIDFSRNSALQATGQLQLWSLDEKVDTFFKNLKKELNNSPTYSYSLEMKGRNLNRSEETKIQTLGIFGEHDVILVEEGYKSQGSLSDFVFSVQGNNKSQSQSHQGQAMDGDAFYQDQGTQDDTNTTAGVYGKCEYCMRYTTLTCACSCKKVEYCSESCRIKDRTYHEPNCDKAGEEEASQLKEYEPNSRKGLTGLENLGNTCFMNSGIQCLSNTYELTEFFLSNDFEKEINEDNAIGTQGKLVRSYANMIKNLWYGTSGHYRPYNFKCTLGRANPMFSGYQQHDSQELICFILDKLHEDLNRIKKKPIVEGIEKEGNETDIQTARRAWIAYKRRNNSKIVDLIFGQLRSKLTCPNCGNTSTTFDPFNFVTLPIPKPFRKEINVFVIRSNFNKPTQSYKFVFTTPETTVGDLKKVLEQKFEIPKERLLIGRLSFKIRGEVYPDSMPLKDMCKMLKKSSTWDAFAMEVTGDELALIANKEDCVHAFSFFNKEAASISWWDSKKTVFAIRPMFLPKKSTAIQIYKRFYEFLNSILEIDQVFEKNQPISDSELTELFSLKKPPFVILLKKGLSDQESYWSSKSKEGGSLIPLTEEDWVLEKNLDLEKANKTEDGGLICELEVLFPGLTDLQLNKLGMSTPLDQEKEGESEKLDLVSCFRAFEQPETLDEMNTWYCRKCKDHVRAKKELRLFKVPDILVVQMKRFKEREHTIHGYYKDYHTSVGSKISTKIDFPLEGLDLDQFVMSKKSIEDDYHLTFDEIFGEDKKKEEADSEETKTESESEGPAVEAKKEETKEEATPATGAPESPPRKLIYDLYAVSNHYGSMNFGHYTAYVKNAFDKNWYDCDDSRVSQVSPKHVVSEAAYVLFYRRRTDEKTN